MTTTTENSENVCFKVRKFILLYGLFLASSIGEAGVKGVNSLGILRDNPKRKQEKLLGILPKKYRRDWVGTIWFDNEPRGANSKNWVFEVHGERELPFAEKMIREMSLRFSVRIHIIQKSVEKTEFFTGDGGW